MCRTVISCNRQLRGSPLKKNNFISKTPHMHIYYEIKPPKYLTGSPHMSIAEINQNIFVTLKTN